MGNLLRREISSWFSTFITTLQAWKRRNFSDVNFEGDSNVIKARSIEDAEKVCNRFLFPRHFFRRCSVCFFIFYFSLFFFFFLFFFIKVSECNRSIEGNRVTGIVHAIVFTIFATLPRRGVLCVFHLNYWTFRNNPSKICETYIKKWKFRVKKRRGRGLNVFQLCATVKIRRAENYSTKLNGKNFFISAMEQRENWEKLEDCLNNHTSYFARRCIKIQWRINNSYMYE